MPTWELLKKPFKPFGMQPQMHVKNNAIGSTQYKGFKGFSNYGHAVYYVLPYTSCQNGA
jgi:hypothetical protein